MDNQTKEIRWIASRMLHSTDNANIEFTIKIGEPEQETEQRWRCPFAFTTSKDEMKVQYAYSIDALGALINAITGLRHQGIEKSDKKLVWLEKEWGHGVPHYIPNFITPAFTEHLEKMVEEEVKKYTEEMKRKVENDHSSNNL